MRISTLAACLLTAAPFAASAQTVRAPAAAPAAAKGHSVEDTDIGTLLDDPAARAVVDKHIPGFSKKDQIESFFRQSQSMATHRNPI